MRGRRVEALLAGGKHVPDHLVHVGSDGGDGEAQRRERARERRAIATRRGQPRKSDASSGSMRRDVEILPVGLQDRVLLVALDPRPYELRCARARHAGSRRRRPPSAASSRGTAGCAPANWAAVATARRTCRRPSTRSSPGCSGPCSGRRAAARSCRRPDSRRSSPGPTSAAGTPWMPARCRRIARRRFPSGCRCSRATSATARRARAAVLLASVARREHERLAVRQRATAVLALLVAEVVEQLVGGHRVVLVDAAVARVVADDAEGNGHLQGDGLTLAHDLDLLVDVVRHRHRAAQRDLFLREAADDRIANVERRVGNVRIGHPEQAECPDPRRRASAGRHRAPTARRYPAG